MGQANFRKNRIIELEAEVAALRKDEARLDWLDTDYPAGDEPRLRHLLEFTLKEYQPIRQALDSIMGETSEVPAASQSHDLGDLDAAR